MKLLEYTSGDGYAALEFDAVEEEGYERSAETTEHAVERGAPIVDHARPNADTITLKAIITNAPLILPRGFTDGVTVSMQPRDMRVGGKAFRASVLTYSSDFDRIGAAHELLSALVGDGLCRYTGSLGTTTEDLLITRYRVDREASTAGALVATIEMKRIRFASTERQSVAPRQRRGQPVEQRGAQPARPESTIRAAGREAVDAMRGALRGMGFGS